MNGINVPRKLVKYFEFIFCRSVWKGRTRWFILCLFSAGVCGREEQDGLFCVYFLQECVEGKNKMVYFEFIFCRSVWKGRTRWFILCLFSAGVCRREE